MDSLQSHDLMKAEQMIQSVNIDEFLSKAKQRMIEYEQSKAAKRASEKWSRWEQMLRDYYGGMTVIEVTRKFGMGRTDFYDLLKRLKMPIVSLKEASNYTRKLEVKGTELFYKVACYSEPDFGLKQMLVDYHHFPEVRAYLLQKYGKKECQCCQGFGFNNL